MCCWYDFHGYHRYPWISFYFLDSAKASHVAWEHVDYQHTWDAFLLERAFGHNGKKPQVVDLPLPRVADILRYYNPTRPSHLRGGAWVRCRRSYSVKPKDFNFRKSDIDVVNYNFDTMMYLSNAREEHVVTYREAVKAARNLLDEIAIVTQGRLPRALISDNRPTIWKSEKIKQGFVSLHMPGIYACLKETSYFRPNSTRTNTSKWPTTRYKWTNVPKTKKIHEFGEFGS